MVPCRNVATESHPMHQQFINQFTSYDNVLICKATILELWNVDRILSLPPRILTSKDAKQYQQNTCLHLLHIIWAQPSSFSIGTEHIGQHLMWSLPKGIPNGRSEQGPLCQGSRHIEQKSVEQLGQWTGPKGVPLPLLPFIEHIVSQPARGHHARPLSIDTSAHKLRGLY